MRNVLRYIKRTKWYGIRYCRGTEFPNKLIVFVDASLGTCTITGRAAYCVIVFLNGGAIYWRCKLLPGKPSTGVLEAEYPASHYATKDATYFRMLTAELGFAQQGPTIIYTDNRTTEILNNEQRMTYENRHLNTKYHSMRWTIEQKVCLFARVSTEDNPSDIGTKIIKDVHKFHRFAKILCHDCIDFDQLTDTSS
jgi:hypothetical protein